MTGPVTGDEAEWNATGTWNTVAEVLRSLGVQGEPKEVQKAAVRRFWRIPATRAVLRRLEGDLRDAGLL